MPAETGTLNPQSASAATSRNRAPVFVLGCGRSGTKLLFHMIMSSGGFAVYQVESNVFNLLSTRFGDLKHRANREKLMQLWLQSKLFCRSGLERGEIEPLILEKCRSGGDFLRLLMEAIARKQGAQRWVEATPLHLLYLPEIKRTIPNALIIHIIRDGRDVAVSLHKQDWIRPYPWDRERGVLVSGIFWNWIVNRGRNYGRALGPDYMEVHYEDLVVQPQETLNQIGAFIEHPMDYRRILEIGIGSVQNPNSSFQEDVKKAEFNPVGRWKSLLRPDQVAQLEANIGPLLEDLGYPLSAPRRAPTAPERLMAEWYPRQFAGKIWLKSHTWLGRTAEISRMGIGQK
jgi:hypothetical protein